MRRKPLAAVLALLSAALVLGGNALLDAGWGSALRSIADRVLPNPEIAMWAPAPEPGSHSSSYADATGRGRTTSTWWTRRTTGAMSESSSSSSSDGSPTARAGSRSRRAAARACATARATRPRRPRLRAGLWTAERGASTMQREFQEVEHGEDTGSR